MAKSQQKDKSNTNKSRHSRQLLQASQRNGSEEISVALTDFADEFAAFHEMNAFLIHALTELMPDAESGSQEDRRGARLLSEHVLTQAANLKHRVDQLRRLNR